MYYDILHYFFDSNDSAMNDFLLSAGIRVGELVRLNMDDIDFSESECVVYYKEDKERKTTKQQCIFITNTL